MSAVILDTSGPDVLSNVPVVVLDQTTHVTVTLESVRLAMTFTFGERDVPVCALCSKAGHQLDKRSISAISDAYFDTSWRGDISWYLDYD